MLWVHYVGATMGLFVFLGLIFGVRRFRAWRAYEQMRKEYGQHWGKSIFDGLDDANKLVHDQGRLSERECSARPTLSSAGEGGRALAG